MDITLDNNTLYEKVSRSLSVIGKRSIDDNGNLLFTDITLGSREKTIANDYFRQAVITLTTELSAFVTTATSQSVTFTITLPDNHNSALEAFLQDACESYCVSYALYSWFVITAPRISSKYADDCKLMLASVIRLAHEKKTPDGNANMADILSPDSVVTT